MKCLNETLARTPWNGDVPTNRYCNREYARRCRGHVTIFEATSTIGNGV
jgi:hypothetical protein